VAGQSLGSRRRSFADGDGDGLVGVTTHVLQLDLLSRVGGVDRVDQVGCIGDIDPVEGHDNVVLLQSCLIGGAPRVDLRQEGTGIDREIELVGCRLGVVHDRNAEVGLADPTFESVQHAFRLPC
jgi:hypothetical protein